MNIAIIGAGKLGITLAQLARQAGHSVFIAGSRSAAKIELTVRILAPGAVATTVSDTIHHSDIVILALPLHKYHTLPVHALAGKLVIDAMNYWWEVDGSREDIVPSTLSTSEAVQAFLPISRVVKALSHMGYHHLHDEPMPKGTAHRKAIAIAANRRDDARQVAEFIDTLGFDPVIIGDLASGRFLEPGHPAFGANTTAAKLSELATNAAASPQSEQFA